MLKSTNNSEFTYTVTWRDTEALAEAQKIIEDLEHQVGITFSQIDHVEKQHNVKLIILMALENAIQHGSLSGEADLPNNSLGQNLLQNFTSNINVSAESPYSSN